MSDSDMKSCPRCDKAVGAWRARCDCGHVFFARAIEPKPTPRAPAPTNPGDSPPVKVHHLKKKHRAPVVETVKVIERVIERQVVVTHCKFCGELTPVDLAKCQSCGGSPA